MAPIFVETLTTLAIADAVREVAQRSDEEAQTPSHETVQTAIGRRGHLRAVPS